MRKCFIIPDGWRRTFQECPPGFFMIAKDIDDNKKDANLFLKSEYSNNDGKQDAYCCSGEYFWGGTDTVKERNKIIVQPVITEWREVEE